MSHSAIAKDMRSRSRGLRGMAVLCAASGLLTLIALNTGCGDGRAAQERQRLSHAQDALSANCIDLANVWRMHHALVAQSTEAFHQLAETQRGDISGLNRSRMEAAQMLEKQCRILERLIKRTADATRDPGHWRDDSIASKYRATCGQLQEQQRQATVVLTSAEHMLDKLRQHDSA
jgi:hypothetical protein